VDPEYANVILVPGWMTYKTFYPRSVTSHGRVKTCARSFRENLVHGREWRRFRHSSVSLSPSVQVDAAHNHVPRDRYHISRKKTSRELGRPWINRRSSYRTGQIMTTFTYEFDTPVLKKKVSLKTGIFIDNEFSDGANKTTIE